jgi:signal transduction histidine kinase
MKHSNSSRNTTSLSIRLATLASLLMLGVAVALTLATVQREQASFRTELEGEAELLLDTLARTTRDQLYQRDIDELDEITDTVSDNESVSRIIIYDDQGYPLADNTLPAPILAQEPDPLGKMLVEREENTSYLHWEQDHLIAGRVVRVGRTTFGAVSIALPTTRLQENIRQATTQGILIAVAAMTIGIALNFAVTRRITQPLRDLTYAARQMSGGNLKIRVEQQSQDEVGELGATFNQMAEAIEKRETDLRELNASLEQQVQDRTAELRRQNDELTLARKRAEEATQLKSQFLANISHELRTPLNAIMGYAQLMQMGIPVTLPDAQKEQVQRIMKSSEALLGLINNLLDLAKIEAGRTELVNKSFTLREWIAGAIRPNEVLAQEKGLQFIVNIDENLPNVIVGDVERLRQIVVNLVSNAVKFTEKGSVAIKLDRLASGSDGRWTITVQDTGAGIPSHAIDLIFEEFRQVDGSATRQYGGTGLGLAIARNLARIMGGTIRVKSKVGEGSSFIVELPLIVAEVPDEKMVVL